MTGVSTVRKALYAFTIICFYGLGTVLYWMSPYTTYDVINSIVPSHILNSIYVHTGHDLNISVLSDIDPIVRGELELGDRCVHDVRWQHNYKRFTRLCGQSVEKGRAVGRSAGHDNNSVAIGSAITSNKAKLNWTHITNESMVKAFVFFREFLPTFAKTAELGYNYHFYLAYDEDDRFFTHLANLNMFLNTTLDVLNSYSVGQLNVFMHFVQCSHRKKPAWAQNDAMVQAYLDNMDYYYRINDDSKLLSANWTSMFIAALHRYDPPLVGVVGPMHKGGNIKILTYDFVHRTHIDIFGFYYPREFIGKSHAT